MEITGKWVCRSVLRGIGPAKQSRPYAIQKLLTLDSEEAPVVADGPTWPLRAILLGCMFLMLEVELAATQVGHVTLDHGTKEVTWRLASSKTDSMALGTTRTWGCLCGVGTLPCPYHIAAAVLRTAAANGVGDLTSAQLACRPLFPTLGNQVPTKAKMVATFEHFAGLTGERITNTAGLRLFGGHTLRVTGAQALAAHGIEVAKIKILARHSSDAIYRYVAEAPLTTLRSDLGLTGNAHSGSTRGTNGGDGVPDGLKLKLKLEAALKKLQEHETALEALRTTVHSSRSITFVQNLRTMAIHGMRAGDSSHTACGWGVGAAVQRRGGIRWLNTIEGEPWNILCERCLLPERRAGQLTAQTLGRESESE